MGCGVYNRPVYEDSGYLRRQTAGQKLPISDELSARLFCMALHPLMTGEEQEYMAAALDGRGRTNTQRGMNELGAFLPEWKGGEKGNSVLRDCRENHFSFQQVPCQIAVRGTRVYRRR